MANLTLHRAVTDSNFKMHSCCLCFVFANLGNRGKSPWSPKGFTLINPIIASKVVATIPGEMLVIPGFAMTQVSRPTFFPTSASYLCVVLLAET
jgi:hypothetical protein